MSEGREGVRGEAVRGRERVCRESRDYLSLRVLQRPTSAAHSRESAR